MIAELENKLEQLDCILNINAGGCALAALAIRDYIKRHDPKSRPIIYYTQPGNVKLAKETKELRHLSCGHAIVKYKDMWIDSTGIHRSVKDKGRYKYPKKKPIPIWSIKMHIRDGRLWNDAFHRGDTRIIDKIFDTNLYWDCVAA
jgi:hypothetical protein